MQQSRVAVAHLGEILPTPCPCGQARRAFQDTEGAPASVHLVEISEDSRPHFHKETTEIYVVLEGEGILEADGKEIPLRPMTAVTIFPGCVHRARGSNLKVLNIPFPPFDPEDEFEVDQA